MRVILLTLALLKPGSRRNNTSGALKTVLNNEKTLEDPKNYRVVSMFF
jgi:hypothetical protein